MEEEERKIVKYFRYFQGDVKLASYENHGTDVYVYLHALAGESVEWLPIWSDTGQWPAVGRKHENYFVSMGSDCAMFQPARRWRPPAPTSATG